MYTAGSARQRGHEFALRPRIVGSSPNLGGGCEQVLRSRGIVYDQPEMGAAQIDQSGEDDEDVAGATFCN